LLKTGEQFNRGGFKVANVFRKRTKHSIFSWDGLGDIAEGRKNLGPEVPVFIYRLLQYTLLDVLTTKYGQQDADDLFRKAGYMAGKALTENALDIHKSIDEFISELQKYLKDNKIGVLKIESFDEKGLNFFLTIGEDLDCSGLKPTNEVVCFYDEGFIQGIMEAYTGKKFMVKEVDCWANGDRVCRFKGCQV
jgi:predicted hydrocarbon binding protein